MKKLIEKRERERVRERILVLNRERERERENISVGFELGTVQVQKEITPLLYLIP